jgi:hypothetical protein
VTIQQYYYFTSPVPSAQRWLADPRPGGHLAAALSLPLLLSCMHGRLAKAAGCRRCVPRPHSPPGTTRQQQSKKAKEGYFTWSRAPHLDFSLVLTGVR